MKTVYVDFDDVLCETARVLAQMLCTEFNKSVTYEQIDSFDLIKSFNLSEQETLRLFDMFHDRNILLQIPHIPGALDALRKWQNTGLCIHIVTGRPPTTHQATMEWLNKRNFTPDRLSFVDKYNRGHTHVDGVDILTLENLRHMPFALAIDDSPIAIDFLAENTETPIIVFDRPWNISITKWDNHPSITRCHSWDAIRHYVQTNILQN
jgi:uncharacterized HAD superfamily protein